MNRHRHEAAWAASKRLVDVVAPCLREEEITEARKEFYTLLMDTLAEYDERRGRELARLGREEG